MGDLRDLRQLLHQGGYYPQEIERILDKKNPAFIKFDPELGYVLLNYVFADGMEGTQSAYTYYKRGGHRKMVHYADQPCRINTYGDSYTQCAQVSDGETWQEVLAAHFREPIRNFGVGGYGVYQAYRRALRTEVQKDLAAEYIILNVWDDDHMRNIDAARWIRVAWMCRDLPRGRKDTYPVHGFPWAHLRYDLKAGKFVECPGMCQRAGDLRKLVGGENFYNAFKDDHAAHLYCLREGGEAPVAELQQIAEALGVKVNLTTKSKAKRTAEAVKLHYAYGMHSTMWIVNSLTDWCRDHGRKLLVLLSYDVPQVMEYLAKGTRFDELFVDFMEKRKAPYVDCLKKAREEFKDYKLTIPKFCEKFYVARAGAQVFGHYSPAGVFWFAQSIRKELVQWLSPKPPAYR